MIELTDRQCLEVLCRYWRRGRIAKPFPDSSYCLEKADFVVGGCNYLATRTDGSVFAKCCFTSEFSFFWGSGYPERIWLDIRYQGSGS